jgi:hypothetical protein
LRRGSAGRRPLPLLERVVKAAMAEPPARRVKQAAALAGQQALLVRQALPARLALLAKQEPRALAERPETGERQALELLVARREPEG